MIERVQCNNCPESFELVPPADKSYIIPREKHTTEDHIKRIYQCPKGHLNTIFWEKKVFVMASAGFDVEEALSDKYTDPLL